MESGKSSLHPNSTLSVALIAVRFVQRFAGSLGPLLPFLREQDHALSLPFLVFQGSAKSNEVLFRSLLCPRTHLLRTCCQPSSRWDVCCSLYFVFGIRYRGRSSNFPRLASQDDAPGSAASLAGLVVSACVRHQTTPSSIARVITEYAEDKLLSAAGQNPGGCFAPRDDQNGSSPL